MLTPFLNFTPVQSQMSMGNPQCTAPPSHLMTCPFT
jgi:hypothetical protein